jgi:hypothetical protein
VKDQVYNILFPSIIPGLNLVAYVMMSSLVIAKVV